MIPILGLIVAVYAIARLLQVPLAHAPQASTAWLWIISILAIVAIGILALVLLASGVAMPVRM